MRMSTRKAARELGKAMDLMAGIVSGIIDRENQHLAMIETLNDRDEVYAKLLALNARINFEFAVLLERSDLADEIRQTVDMAGAVIDQIDVEFREKT
jgi:hypothetical protein